MRSAAPLAALVALVGVAAAAVSGVGAGSATLRAQPTSVLLTVALTLLALAGLASVVAAAVTLSRLLRQSGGFGRERRPLIATVVASVVSAGVFFLLIYLLVHYRRPRLSSPHPSVSGSGARLPASRPSAVHFVPSASFGTLAVLLAITAVFLGMAMWRRRGRSGWQSSYRVHESPGAGRDEEAGGTDVVSMASAIGSVRVADPREEPDPRRAVVLAYMDMTEAAEAAGARRLPHETPREFLVRLLASVGAPEASVRTITTLFELARYSSAPVTEADRTVAISSLDEIRFVLSVAAPC